jgi:large subunit ribosomal protein L28
MIPYLSLRKLQNHMAKICPITKKGSQVGGGYSNRIRATKFNPTGKVRKQPNLQKKRIFVPEINKTITLTLSTQAIKTIAKNGAYKTLKGAGLI